MTCTDDIRVLRAQVEALTTALRYKGMSQEHVDMLLRGVVRKDKHVREAIERARGTSATRRGRG